jgi:hypothetical protein
MRRALVSLGIAAGLAAARPASAADPPISVAVRECPDAPLSIDAFLGSLRVELAAEGQPCCARTAESAAPPAAGAARNPVSVAVQPCGVGPDLVVIQVRHARTGAVLDRQVSVGDVSPDARPRALALAVAELIRAAGAVVPPPPAPPPTPAPPSAAPEPSDLDGWLPNAAFVIRTHPSGNLTLWGFHGGVEYARAGWAGGVEAFIESGNPTVPLGSVDTTFAGGQLRFGRRFRLARVPFEVAVAGTLGRVRMDGVTSVPGATVSGGAALVSAAGVRVAYDFWPIPHDRARVRLVAEAGGVLSGLEATVNDRDAAGVTGFYAVAGLGFALGPYAP